MFCATNWFSADDKSSKEFYQRMAEEGNRQMRIVSCRKKMGRVTLIES
jgi:hypothetical protein